MQYTIALVSDAPMKSKLSLAPVNHDCHAMVGKHCTKPRGICRASLWSANTRDTKRMYM